MKKFAVFDIDGTLIRWQLYHTLVDRLAKEGVMGEQALQNFSEARMHWKRREDLDAFETYEMQVVTAFEKALSSVEPELLDQLVKQVVDQYKDQVYRYTRDLLKSLKQQDYFLIAISGSHHELIAEIAKYYGFDDFVGSKFERKDGKFTGRRVIASLNKQEILREMVQRHGLTYDNSVAIGDSRSDATMLKIVENPVAFNPDQNLYKIAAKNNWKIVLERKNMIYHLEKKDGQYVLAETN